MKFKITFLTLLFLTIIGCENYKKKEKILDQKEYGKWRKDNESLSVELNYKKHNNWNKIINEAERITCNDSIAKITLKAQNILKTIYFQNPCWKNFGCILIKEKNVIEIHNNKIRKNFGDFYNLDVEQNKVSSLENISTLNKLKSLNITDTRISEISLNEIPDSLKEIHTSKIEIENKMNSFFKFSEDGRILKRN